MRASRSLNCLYIDTLNRTACLSGDSVFVSHHPLSFEYDDRMFPYFFISLYAVFCVCVWGERHLGTEHYSDGTYI